MGRRGGERRNQVRSIFPFTLDLRDVLRARKKGKEKKKKSDKNNKTDYEKREMGREGKRRDEERKEIRVHFYGLSTASPWK